MEVANARKLGIFLRVPSVQELAKEKSATVPLRYVRPDKEPEVLSSINLLEVPVIDMKILLDGDLKDAELNKLHITCKEWGFCKLKNHGVSDSLLEKMKTEVDKFFKLPLEDKSKFGQLEGDIEGYGQAFAASNEQKLDWADVFHISTLPTDMRKPHLLPQLPQSFRLYHNVEHRGVVNSVKGRMSIATFLGPKLDGEFGPAPSLLSSQACAMFKRIGFTDFLKGVYAHNLDGKCHLDALRM